MSVKQMMVMAMVFCPHDKTPVLEVNLICGNQLMTGMSVLSSPCHMKYFKGESSLLENVGYVLYFPGFFQGSIYKFLLFFLCKDLTKSCYILLTPLY